jgi:glycogen synthase
VLVDRQRPVPVGHVTGIVREQQHGGPRSDLIAQADGHLLKPPGGLRVLHITSEYPPFIWGGLGTAVGGLVNASARGGLTVAIVLVGETVSSGSYRLPADIDLVPLGFARPAAWKRDSSLVHYLNVNYNGSFHNDIAAIRSWRPDILHLHTTWLLPLARTIKAVTRAPLVYTCHAVHRAEHELGGLAAVVHDWREQGDVLALAERIIALTESERRLLCNYYPWVRDSLRVVGNGVHDVPAVSKGQQNRRRDPITVLYVGRFDERKGICELMEAIPIVLASAPLTRFVLAGGWRGIPVSELEGRWVPQALWRYRHRMHITGWVEATDLARFYRSADILVVPSRYEPFGLVILEGMMHGLPVVAAAVGGPSAILSDQRTGLLFPAGNVDALAECILHLVGNPALREKLGSAAAREAREKWLWPAVAPKVWAVYADLI